MEWQQLRIHTQQPYVEALEDVLNEAGALSITLTDAADEAVFVAERDSNPLWQDVCLLCLFDERYQLQPLISYLEQRLSHALTAPLTTARIAEQNWQQQSQSQFSPITIADKLTICPSWQVIDDDACPTVIIEPGLAFGTGLHPTTNMCLRWLAQHVSPGDRVIDYGCGSGILALAAAKLGAKTVYAIDNDPQAITATENNLALNTLGDCDFYIGLNDQLHPLGADILIANILQNPLLSLAPHFAKLIKANAKLALTGLLAEQADTVIKAYKPYANLQPVMHDEGWVLLAV